MEELSHNPGWVMAAGTALSALGATLNGINSLYGLAAHSPAAAAAGLVGDSPVAIAGNMASGAMALLGGCMAASKVTAVGSGLSLTPVGLGAGVAYASIGLLFFMYSVARLSTRAPPRHSPVKGSGEAKLFPSPDWLSTRVLNWGVMGRVGVGKSTLINALRGLHPRATAAAPVGIGHTTRKPKPYNFVGDVAVLTRNMARLWDLPGAGTKDWPCASYVRDAGLRHFDGVIFVTSDAFSELEAALMRQLQEFQVPYYIVRNKVDQDVFNNAEDNNRSVEESLAEIRHELVDRGCDPARSFLISAKNPQCADFEFGNLLRTMANDVVLQRSELPEFIDSPLCGSAPSAPTQQDAVAFAALAELPPAVPSVPLERCEVKRMICSLPAVLLTRQTLPAAAEQSAVDLTRISSPVPSTSAPSFETPPPTRLHMQCVSTPEPVALCCSSGIDHARKDSEESFYECIQPPCFTGSSTNLERLQL